MFIFTYALKMSKKKKKHANTSCIMHKQIVSNKLHFYVFISTKR